MQGLVDLDLRTEGFNIMISIIKTTPQNKRKETDKNTDADSKKRKDSRETGQSPKKKPKTAESPKKKGDKRNKTRNK